MNDSPSVAVVFDAPAVVPAVKARWYHYVAGFFWNLYRKPLVWKRQRELLLISAGIKKSLEETVLPVLWEHRRSCSACYNAYLSLKPQIFLSQIELILKRMECKDHLAIFRTFLVTWGAEFKRSDELARWINGL